MLDVHVCSFLYFVILSFLSHCLPLSSFHTFFILSSFDPFIFPVLVSLFISFSPLYFHSLILHSFCPAFFCPLCYLYIFALPVTCLLFLLPLTACLLHFFVYPALFLPFFLTLSFHACFRFGLLIAFLIYFLVFSSFSSN